MRFSGRWRQRLRNIEESAPQISRIPPDVIAHVLERCDPLRLGDPSVPFGSAKSSTRRHQHPRGTDNKNSSE